ncbi:MAG: hypothetical protein L6R37_007562, partial [Teloschistes peruensis]
MIVLSGSATVRFGVADDEAVQTTESSGKAGIGGIEIQAEAGDAFLVPAGVAHKTFDTRPQPSTLALLTPGDGHGVDCLDPLDALARIELEGFCMLGAYPAGAAEWDFVVGGEDVGKGGYEKVWGVPVPGMDPILGERREGMR